MRFLIIFLLSAFSAFALPPSSNPNQFSGGNPISILTNGAPSLTTNILYVSKGGDNSTALANRLDKPFLTLAAAKTAWASGYNIEVLPGTYSEALSPIAGDFHWDFLSGSKILFTNSAATNLFTITSGTVTVAGDGHFENRSTNVGYGVVINGGTLNFSSKSLIATNHASDYAISQNNGTLFATVDRVAGRTGGLLWTKGESHLHAKTIHSDLPSQGAVWSAADGAGSGNLWVTADEIDGAYLSGSGGSDGRVWIDVKQIASSVFTTGDIYSYVRAQKIKGGNMTHAFTATSTSGGLWLNAQKIATGTDYGFEVGGGKNHIQFQEIDDLTNASIALIKLSADPFIGRTNTVFIEGQTAIGGTNANGLECVDCKAIVQIGVIDTSANTNGHPVFVSGDLVGAGDLILRNTRLVGASTNYAITASDAYNVKIEGFMTTTNPIDPDITLTGDKKYVAGDTVFVNGTLTAKAATNTQPALAVFSGSPTAEDYDIASFYGYATNLVLSFTANGSVVSSGNIQASGGTITASSFIGSGSGLTTIPPAAITGIAATLNGTNVFSGTNTFTNIIVSKLQLGGNTASFPMITNNGADLQGKLADGSAMADAYFATVRVGGTGTSASATAALNSGLLDLRSTGEIRWSSTSASAGAKVLGLTNSGGGFLKVTDGLGGTGGIIVSNISSTATIKTPVAVAVGASPFSFTNGTGVNLECYFSGATAFAISKNAAAVFGSLAGDAYFILQPSNVCVITYTVAPTFFTNAW